jgi:thiol-disulfide isomerase/thioredoxin
MLHDCVMNPSDPAPLSPRRRWLWAGAAGAAGLAGLLAYRWWPGLTGSAAAPQDPLVAELLGLELELPQGGLYKMSALAGKPTVVNFWATWCPPCVEELPLIERFYQQNKAKNWQVIGLAVDNAKAVSQFLGKLPLSFPTPLAGLAGIELTRKLGNLSGGLPFTVVLNAQGQIAHRHMGKLSAEQVDALAQLP